MKFSILMALVFITILSRNARAQDNKKLKVTVLYESLCPDSRSWIQNQLFKNYEELKDKIDLTLVPFGKSKSHISKDRIHFSCQHGRSECEKNKYQSCVLNLIPDQDTQVSYVSCAMKYSYEMDYCAEEVAKVNMEMVQECRDGNLGTQLQLEAEKLSTHIIDQSHFVPTIVFSDQYDHITNWQAIIDFKKVVSTRDGQSQGSNSFYDVLKYYVSDAMGKIFG